MDTIRYTCSWCGEAFETEEDRSSHMVVEHDEHRTVRELERIVDSFSVNTERVRQLKQERDELSREVERLRRGEVSPDTVEELKGDLEQARNEAAEKGAELSRLNEKLDAKEEKIRRLENQLKLREGPEPWDVPADDGPTPEEKLQQRINELEHENKKLKASLADTKALMESMKNRVEDFEKSVTKD